MTSQDRTAVTRPEAAERDRGAVLILAILMMFIGSVLALSVIFVTETEMKTSASFDDHQMALMAAEAGVQEVLYRLRMTNDATVAPTAGSMITGKGPSNNAYLNPDDNKITWALAAIGSDSKPEGNGIDEDGDGDDTDELDELDRWRDWRIYLVDDYTYSDSDQTDTGHSPAHLQLDNDTKDTTMRGDRLVVPTVFSTNDLLPSSVQSETGSLRFTKTFAEFSADHDDDEVLQVRFLKESDLGMGDIDGDGNTDELVYFDVHMPSDGTNNGNSIAGGGTDTTSDNESPYNIDYAGETDKPKGYPVLLISSTGRVIRRGEEVAKRKLEVRVSYQYKSYASAAICACSDIQVGGSSEYHSYDSKLCISKIDSATTRTDEFGWLNTGDCKADDVYQSDVATNANMTVKGSGASYYGVLKGYQSVTFDGNTPSPPPISVQSHGPITGGCPTGTLCMEYDLNMEEPCLCKTDAEMDELMATYADSANHNNDDAGYMEPGQKSYWNTDLTGSGPFKCNASTELTFTDYQRPQFKNEYGAWWFKAGGHYYFEEWNLHPKGRILVSNSGPNGSCQVDRDEVVDPINIYVNSGFNWVSNEDYQVFQFVRPSEYILWYNGTTSFEFKGNRQSTLSLYAPKSSVVMTGTADIQGFLVVKGGSGSGSYRMWYDRNAREAYQIVQVPRIISWEEIE